MRNIAHLFFLFARHNYKLLKFCAQPLKRFPKIWAFGTALCDAIKDLLSEKEVGPYTKIADPIMHNVLPNWLVEEMKNVHRIEPRIFPSKQLLHSISEHIVPETRLAEPYKYLVSVYGENVTHVLLVPWVNRGGADLVTINYLKVLTKLSSVKRIILVATYPSESLWKNKIPPEITFIEFGMMFKHLSNDEQRKLLAMFLVQMAPPVIHNINSELGYVVFCMHGNALKTQSHLFASSFCFEYSQEGLCSGYSVSYIPECYESLSAVFSDNETHIHSMMNLFGFSENKFSVHYQPAPTLAKKRPTARQAQDCLNILWAGRIARQKRPDILIEIARQCQHKHFSFHVYGMPDHESHHYLQLFAEIENIHYHGAFDGLSTLSGNKFDVFLYTSQWDGLPNILLEAIAMHLPVISADVGGIGEIIKDKETGFLVQPQDNYKQYIAYLDLCATDQDVVEQITSQAIDLIVRRHTWKNFSSLLLQHSSYILSSSTINGH